MKKNLIILLLILNLFIFGYFFFVNDFTASEVSPALSEPNSGSANVIFESTGNARQDLKNMVTFVNAYIGKREDILYELKDYLSIKDDFNYAPCKPKLVNYKMWSGSASMLDSLYINTIGEHIEGVKFLTNGNVSVQTVNTIIDNYLDKSLQLIASAEYLGRNSKQVYVIFSIRNERRYEDKCNKEWHRY